MARFPQICAAIRTLTACALLGSARTGTSDDRVDGVSEDSFDPASWDHLMKDTGMAPIVIPPTSTTQAAEARRYRAWLEKRLLEPALESLKGAPDAAELAVLLPRLADKLAGIDEAVPDDAMLATLKEFAQGDPHGPFVDFLLAESMVRNSTKENTQSLFREVAEAPTNSGLPGVLRLEAQARLLVEADNLKEGDKRGTEDRFYEIFAAHLREKLDPDDVNACLNWHLAYPLDSVRYERGNRYVELYRDSALPEWARLTLIGATDLQLAWKDKKRGMQDMNDEERRHWREHMADAKKVLEKAWELYPASPYAPWEMIIYEREMHRKGPELRLWFDRTVAAECDYFTAYQDYLHGISPSFGGSFSQMLAFGRACAETGRFDTEIPTVLSEAVNRIGRDLYDWRPLYKHPGISALLLETRKRRAEKVAGTPAANLQWSQLALESWLAGDYAQAARAIDTIRGSDGIPLGNWTSAADAGRITVGLPFAFHDAALRGGPFREDYTKAVSLLSRGKPAEARPLFEKALATPDVWSRDLVSSDVELAKFQEKYATGEWAPLPLSSRLCWDNLAGYSKWLPESGRLTLTAPLEFGKTLFRGNLGPNFELRGHFFSPRDRKTKPAGLGIFNGHPPFGTGGNHCFWQTVRFDPMDDHHFWVHHAMNYDGQPEAERKVAAWKDDNTFLYRCNHGRISFSVGGDELIHEVGVPDDLPSGERAVGFGILQYGRGSHVEIWDWDARRLDLPL